MKRTALVVLALILTGCAGNPYVKFYQDRTGGYDLTKAPALILPTDDPKLFQGNNPEGDHTRMLEDGYAFIGFSSFNGGNVNVTDAQAQAKTAHAAVVLVYSKYTGTQSGVIPLTVPDTQTSTTTFSGTTLGRGGPGSFSGTVDTTTYGSQTMYMPYKVDRHDYLATYWIKKKPPVLGVEPQDLTAETRQKLQSNKGILVLAVVKNSPAYRADVLKGDIIRKVNDVDVYEAAAFRKLIVSLAGQKVVLDILRNGNQLQKEIQMDHKSW